jgi:hypothetical protein
MTDVIAGASKDCPDLRDRKVASPAISGRPVLKISWLPQHASRLDQTHDPIGRLTVQMFVAVDDQDVAVNLDHVLQYGNDLVLGQYVIVFQCQKQ